jgi:hypothetical protein
MESEDTQQFESVRNGGFASSTASRGDFSFLKAARKSLQLAELFVH